MSESSEENTTQVKEMTGMRRLGIAYSFKFCTGILLIILGAVASGHHMKNSGEMPYYIGAFLTGIAMSLVGVINFRNWQNIRQGKASMNQKFMCVGIEAVICIISVVLGFVGLIIVGINGINAPMCLSSFGSCSNHKSTSTYKIAVAILVFMIVSIIINIVYFLVLHITFKKDGVDIFKGRRNMYLQNRHHQQPLTGTDDQTTNAPIVLNTRHGQPEAYGGAILHPGVSSVPSQPAYSTNIQNAPIVLNSRHGQPEAYGGAILHPGVSSVPSQPANSTGIQNDPIVLNTRHGQPEAYGGAILHPGVSSVPSQPAYSTNIQNAPIVLNSRHGQPEPYGGAIIQSGLSYVPNQSGNVTCIQDQAPVVINYHHGQPEPFAGVIISRPGDTGDVPVLGPHGQHHAASTGYVLNTHHGQPQPFEGAVLSTPSQHAISEGNHSLVLDLQEQNRLLREQLALQQQQQQQQQHQQQRTVESSAPDDGSPPSYEACMKDPSKIKYLEEQNRNLKSRFQKHEDELAGNSSEAPDYGSHPNPSAPPM